MIHIQRLCCVRNDIQTHYRGRTKDGLYVLIEYWDRDIVILIGGDDRCQHEIYYLRNCGKLEMIDEIREKVEKYCEIEGMITERGSDCRDCKYRCEYYEEEV